MWILRGPKTNRYGVKERTDGVEPERLRRYTKHWELGDTPYFSITLGGTIKENARRKTELSIGFSEEDIIVLCQALLKRYRNRSARLSEMEYAMHKIKRLRDHRKFSRPEKQVEAIQIIAEHYSWTDRKGNPRIPGVSWAKL